MAQEMDLSRDEYYTNRELSWLLFNERVLAEAKDKQIPLFERIKFLSITASNLDEFFMVRVASLKDMVNAGYKKRDIAGMTASEQLAQVNEKTHQLVNQQYNTYNRSLLPQLSANGLHLVSHHEDLTKEEGAYVDSYFTDNVYPVLTPMAVDSSRPFPLIRNKSLNLGALVTKKNGDGELEFATVQVPSVLSRLVELPSKADRKLILLEEVIERNIHKLFLNYDIVCTFPFRIMRNADLSIEEEEAEDLLQEIEKQLKKRQWGQVIRLEVEDGIDSRLLKLIREELSIPKEDIYAINGPLDLTF
ncbi:MAG: RNA degradosome polyphosphate kinase, partial [Lachnospiraceae bacterium]|nr:RNA degradosome polyphosphate kinase [Lachnospiraceae bacterium]